MANDLTAKVDKLTDDVEQLMNKRKDGWDKFQTLASLLLPASIAIVGFFVSTSVKDAQITSAQKMAAGQQAVARINAHVGQAGLVKSFMNALLSAEPRKRKLAIAAMLIALPDDGPRLARIVSETDPDQGVRQYAITQQRMESLLTIVDRLPDDVLLKLVKHHHVQDPEIKRIISLRDPTNRRATDPAAARQIIKMMMVMGKRDAPHLDAWESEMSKLVANRANTHG